MSPRKKTDLEANDVADKPSRSTTGKTRGRKKLVKGETYPEYDPTASRDDYRVGDVVKFQAVRNWNANGELVEAFGKIVGVGIFDKTVPYIEVSFSDVKKLNKYDLGSDIRRFILEQKE